MNIPKPMDSHNSVKAVFKRWGPKQLFITEWDSIYPKEEEESKEPEEDEDGKKKKKKPKKDLEIKSFPTHKFQFPALGRASKNLDNILNDPDTGHITLSCFTPKDRWTQPSTKRAIKDLIAEKKAKLDAICKVDYTMAGVEGDGDVVLSEGKEEEEEVLSPDRVGEEDGDALKDESESDEPFDPHHTFEEDHENYGKIVEQFNKNNIPFVEKRLKHAVYYKNSLPESVAKGMTTIEKSYPKILDQLFVNPFAEKKGAKKKKKKK